MRKVFLFFSLSVLVMSFTYAQDPNLTAPNSGTWVLGKPCTITWTYTGTLPLKLVLRQNGQLAGSGIISDSIPPGTTSLNWTVGLLADGTKVGPGTGYKIRIRPADMGLYDESEGDLTFVEESPGSKPHFDRGVSAEAFTAFQFLDPARGAEWKITETYQIKWKVLKNVVFPLRVELIRSDNKTVAANIGSVKTPVGAGGESGLPWTIPSSVADGRYHVRVTSADQKESRLSWVFQIGSTRIRKFEIAPETIANKVHWHEVRPGGGGFITAWDPAVECPGSGIMRYGYQRFYDDKENYGRRLYRSFVFFNVRKEITKNLIALGAVKSAFLTWQMAPGSPQSCPGHVLCLDAPLTLGDGSSMFGEGFNAFPKHTVVGPQSTMDMVQVWLNDAGKNYGLVIGAATEGTPNTNSQCVQCSQKLRLKVEVEENLRSKFVVKPK